MNDPWTKTMGWGLTVGAGGGWGRGEQWWKIGTTGIKQQERKERRKEGKKRKKAPKN